MKDKLKWDIKHLWREELYVGEDYSDIPEGKKEVWKDVLISLKWE